MLAAVRGLRSDLAPVDRVHVAFYAFVLAWCVVRFPALPNPAVSVSWYAGALLLTFCLARFLRGRTGYRASIPRVVFAFTAAPISYLLLGDVVPFVNPLHGERLLKAIDDAMFLGSNPNVLLDRIAWPPLTEVLQLTYSVYYAIPIVLLICLLAQRNEPGIARGLFLVLLCLYGSYVGYFLVPATGPNINCAGLYPSHFCEPMPGLWMAERIRAALLEAEAIKHDCWPSGHTALSWTCVIIAWREKSRVAFWLLLFPAIGIIFATMYLRYHYVVDVLFGFALAWAVLRFGPRLYERMLGAGRGAAGLPQAPLPK